MGVIMKKIIFLILLSFLLAGCDSQYTIEIGNNKIKESLITIMPVEKNETCESKALNECDDDSDEITNSNIFPLINNYDAEYKLTNEYNEKNYISSRTFDFTYENFKDSYVLNNCFENFKYEYKKGNIYINAIGFTNCYNNSDITVKVITSHKVIESNADKREGNTYIWNINNTNYLSKDFSIKVQSFTLKPVFNWIFIIAPVLLISAFFIKKSQKINEIK